MKDRLRQIIDNKNYSIRQFEQKISASEGTISKFLCGKIGLKVETLLKIAANFPEINLDWLITGRGEMIFSQPATQAPHDTSQDALTLIADLARENGQLQAENAELKKELAHATTTTAVSAKAVNE